jgi:hypothetical protein
MAIRSLDDLSTQKQIAMLRAAAEALRTGGKDAEGIKLAELFKPEYRDELADMSDDLADRIEAGEDPFAEEEEIALVSLNRGCLPTADSLSAKLALLEIELNILDG